MIWLFLPSIWQNRSKEWVECEQKNYPNASKGHLSKLSFVLKPLLKNRSFWSLPFHSSHFATWPVKYSLLGLLTFVLAIDYWNCTVIDLFLRSCIVCCFITRIGDAGIIAIARGCPQLSFLNVTGVKVWSLFLYLGIFIILYTLALTWYCGKILLVAGIIKIYNFFTRTCYLNA